MIKIELVDPKSLKMADYNPRTISDDGLGRLVKLLDNYGFVDPIIARREDGLVIGGHQRLRANALRESPSEKVPCVFLDKLSDAKAKALNIALNNQEAQGSFVQAELADLLQDIDTGDFDVPGFTGFSKEDIAGLVHGLDEFQPVDEEPSRLDEKEPVKCPECGHEFTT